MSETHDTAGAVGIELGHEPLTLDRLDALLGRRLRPVIADAARKRVGESRAAIEKALTSGRAIYGVNTGFGKLCQKRISNDQLALLQENLLVSHAVGVGEPVPPHIVRWMLLFKINALLAGASGVQPACVEALAAMLSHDVLPVVPTRGSLGASGDLAPLAHMVLPLIGRGMVLHEDCEMPAAEAFSKCGIEPVRLGAKDGLALINGTQLILAYAADICVRARRLAKLADVFATMSLEAYRGSLAPFREELIALRPHPGAIATAENVRRMMRDSEVLLSHADCDKVQDPYSLRCVPQVHGGCRDVLRQACAAVEIELNAVTDNPVLLEDEVVSGGNFHAEPLALALDALCMALTEWASISERRVYLLLGGPDGLPTLLLRDTGLNSGYMIPQYTAAAMVNECKVLSMPASVDTIPTSLGQEDHVSMGATSALKCWQVIDRAETALSIELLCAAQALDYRLPTRPGIGPRAAHEVVRRYISHSEADRPLGEDMQLALQLVRNGEIVAAVERECGVLH